MKKGIFRRAFAKRVGKDEEKPSEANAEEQKKESSSPKAQQKRKTTTNLTIPTDPSRGRSGGVDSLQQFNKISPRRTQHTPQDSLFSGLMNDLQKERERGSKSPSEHSSGSDQDEVQFEPGRRTMKSPIRSPIRARMSQ